MKVRHVTTAMLRRWPLPSLGGDDSKEERGRVLIVGGSRSVPGAVLLAATASLRAGAGKLQVATGRHAALPLAIVLPEAKVTGLPSNARGEISGLDATVLHAIGNVDAVLVGPGMDPARGTLRIASAIMRRASAVVLDAGAIVACMSARAGDLVLTPHTGELAGLIGTDERVIAAQKLAIAAECARASRATLVLKGADTVIASPDGDVWVHAGACVGLGTSGSGDVLAGVIVGLLAQGAEAAQAAVWGVTLHARAGALLSRAQGRIGFLAREIPACIPGVMDAMRGG